MTQYLPPNLLALFAPRDPIPYLPPLDKLPHEKDTPGYIGVSWCLKEFEDPKDTPPPTRVETKDERSERKKKERAEQVAYKLEQDLAMWDPANDATINGDPFKTLFVARVNFDTSESKLRREFESYGPVKRITMISATDSKPRGYAFIEYEHERDMHFAYKHADGKKIDGRRVLVDVERGRTVKGWRPRRLGGGLGGTRKGGPDVNTKFSGREGRDDEIGFGGRDRSRSRGRGEVRAEGRGGGERDERRGGDRDRKRRRSRDRHRRSRSRGEGTDERRRGRRSRSRHRSRSRDRKQRRRSSRERIKRSRSRGRYGGPGGENPEGPAFEGFDEVRVKEEKLDERYDQAQEGQTVPENNGEGQGQGDAPMNDIVAPPPPPPE